MHSLALGEISTPITKGATPTTYGFEWQASGVPFLRSECVSEKGLDMRQSMFISSEAHASLQRSQVVEGDILLTITGNIGRVVQLEGIEEANINQHIARVRVIDDRLHPRYVFHYLSQRAVRQYYESITTGQAYPQISLAQVRSTAIPLISKIEQKEIVAALDDADMLISSLEHLISKKQAIKQGVMQELLTGRTRLLDYRTPWRKRKIGDFATVKAGGTPSTSVSRYWGGEIRWMSSGEVHQKRVHEVIGRITESGLRESSAQLLPAGSVLIALAGQGKTRGTVAISEVELSTNQSIAGILPSKDHDPDYLYYNLDRRYKELRGESTGDGGRGGLNLTIIKALEVPMPEIEEQRAIARILQDADTEIDTLERRLESARNIKQGMMQELLTGRTRLPVEEVSS